MHDDRNVSRRDFVKQSVVGAAALAAGATPALGAQAAKPVRVATIGCGGMGNGHLDTMMRLKQAGEAVEIVGVCDVFEPRLQAAAQKTGAVPYANWQDVLKSPDIDAVSIATPDHWHAPITVAALDAGKDVYCEKPMTYWKDLKAPQDVVKAVQRNGRVMQVGTQGMSDSIWEQVAQRLQAGAVGGLVHAQASDMRNGNIGVYAADATDPSIKPGGNLDWDMWLGPAPKHEFVPARFLAFRSFWDYSGGTGTDFFPHILTPLIRTMNLTFPHRVTASGGLYQWHDGREVPDIFNVVIEYPEGPSLLLVSALSTSSGLPMVIRGKEGTVLFEGPGAVIEPQREWRADAQREEIARTRGASLDEHWKDFLNCVRTREKPRSNETLGYYCMTALHMAIHSYRRGRVMEFDPKEEKAEAV